jgi:hypothetical protein
MKSLPCSVRANGKVCKLELLLGLHIAHPEAVAVSAHRFCAVMIVNGVVSMGELRALALWSSLT